MSFFFLEAYEKVYKSKVVEYEMMSKFVDDKVKYIEHGMLIHAQTKISENEHLESLYIELTKKILQK